MEGITIVNYQIIRGINILSVLILFIISPLYGFMYGTPHAVTVKTITIISPLEWILSSLSLKHFELSLLIPALTGIFIIIFLGRILCGWICPVGLLLEYLHKILPWKNRRSNEALIKNREKYVILIGVLLGSYLFSFTAPYIFSPPGIIYRMIISYIFHGIIGTDIIILALIVTVDVSATRYDRTWCNTICPLGTLVSYLSLINLGKPKIDHQKCIQCRDCIKICPMRIPLLNEKSCKWTLMACHKCLKCVEKCPVKAITIQII